MQSSLAICTTPNLSDTTTKFWLSLHFLIGHFVKSNSEIQTSSRSCSLTHATHHSHSCWDAITKKDEESLPSIQNGNPNPKIPHNENLSWGGCCRLIHFSHNNDYGWNNNQIPIPGRHSHLPWIRYTWIICVESKYTRHSPIDHKPGPNICSNLKQDDKTQKYLKHLDDH